MRVAALLFLLAVLNHAEYRAPAGTRYALRGRNGSSILPGGRVIEPRGQQLITGPGPFGLAISPSGKSVATANLGLEQSSVTWLERDKKGVWTGHNFVTARPEFKEAEFRSLFFGIAFQNEKAIWLSEGETGRVRLTALDSGSKRKSLDLNGPGFTDSFAGDLVFDAARNILYVVDQANFRVVVFDGRKGNQIASVAVGRLPFALALAPDGNRLYVTNVGLFRYHVLPGSDEKRPRETGIPFPAFGFPSTEAEKALGDPNVQESNSVCVVDVEQPSAPKIVSFVHTGVPFGKDNAGGSSPSGVLATADAVYVSNAHNDSVDVIDAKTNEIKASIELRVPGLEKLRGILPLGLAFDETRRWLLVAEAGINAIGIIDTATNKVLGHMPAGWFPARLVVYEGMVTVANVKGRGTGPNTSIVSPDAPEFYNVLRRGSLSHFVLPDKIEIETFTNIVLAANGFVPLPDAPKPSPPIQHVVIVVKENRTFDEVFGDMKTVNGPLMASPQLARLGEHGYAEGSKNRFSLQNINVTPNHHALARQFAFSDNFYADSDVSVDGHHWIVGAYPDAWTESSLLAAYVGQKNFKLNDNAPGRLSFAGSNSSVHPEEQPQAGSLWQHLERHNISFRNFGEGFELAGNEEGTGEKPTGTRLLTNVPMPDALFRNTSRNYPGFNMNIPDQYRAAQLMQELDSDYAKSGKPLPRVLFIHLPNDHMAAPRPEDGFPYAVSYTADNDIALGKIVEYLSNSPWWRDMAIFVTEDDAQGGRDHIDAHRTVLLGIGPWFRANYASHVNASFPSLLKTVFQLLRIPALNLFDAAATDLTDMFSTQPNFTPYKALTTDPRLFDPALAREPMDPKPSIPMDRPLIR